MKTLTHDIAELVSLALTSPAMIFGSGVVVLFARDAFDAFLQSDKLVHHWLILGIFIGFAGTVLDNLYWAIPWSLSYIDHPAKDFFHNNGVYPNIFSRQLCTWAAAYCHVRAAISVDNPDNPADRDYILNAPKKRILRRLTIWSAVVGVIYVLALVALRYVK